MALGLIVPVATVVLPVTLLALREALPVAALEGIRRAAWGAQGLSRGSRASREATGSWAAIPARTPATLTAALLVAAVLTVLHRVTDPEQGLAELVPACELVGGVALCRGGEADARLTQYSVTPTALGIPSRPVMEADSAPWAAKDRNDSHPHLGPSRLVAGRSRAQRGQRTPGDSLQSSSSL